MFEYTDLNVEKTRMAHHFDEMDQLDVLIKEVLLPGSTSSKSCWTCARPVAYLSMFCRLTSSGTSYAWCPNWCARDTFSSSSSMSRISCGWMMSCFALKSSVQIQAMCCCLPRKSEFGPACWGNQSFELALIRIFLMLLKRWGSHI